jgi:transcriptional regulator with XRE-family HTH domain
MAARVLLRGDHRGCSVPRHTGTPSTVSLASCSWVRPSDLHQRLISNVETGKRNPSYASLRRLAAGLDLAASELLARAEQLEANGGRANKTKAASRR